MKEAGTRQESNPGQLWLEPGFDSCMVTASLFLFSPHNISIVRQDALSVIFVH